MILGDDENGTRRRWIAMDESSDVTTTARLLLYEAEHGGLMSRTRRWIPRGKNTISDSVAKNALLSADAVTNPPFGV
ncbi:hypothetical protein Bca52824_036094 [Brassica carinata]|uniref:Uncharacterized protein n=1 Tax=Brassica carinata TaxID=52824 RepID=A0A8X7S4L0_BRACI|nr:hypothetical protein Bca52824_036094 [Brassica carinata]